MLKRNLWMLSAFAVAIVIAVAAQWMRQRSLIPEQDVSERKVEVLASPAEDVRFEEISAEESEQQIEPTFDVGGTEAALKSPPPPETSVEPSVVTDGDIGARRNQLVATVNGVDITIDELLPSAKARVEQDEPMSREMFEYRLGRAIERELIFQAARLLEVQLNEEQIQELANRREFRRDDDTVVDPIGDPDAALEYELHQDQAFLLEKMLLEKEGVPLPYVTKAQVEQYYQDHVDDYELLPEGESANRQAAWQRIELDIRKTLSAVLRSEYQREREEYFAQLKDQASIVVHVGAAVSR